MRIRLQPCIGLVLVAMLGAANAEEALAGAGASSASLLEPSRTLILLDYQKVDVRGDAPIDLMGAHFVRPVNDWLLLGAGVQVPLVSGSYGGFATFDVGAYAKHHLWSSRVFVTAGFFAGAGAGGRSVENAKTLSGSGTLMRAYVGTGYDFGNFSVGVNLSKLQIRHSAIDATQADVFLELPQACR